MQRAISRTISPSRISCTLFALANIQNSNWKWINNREGRIFFVCAASSRGSLKNPSQINFPFCYVRWGHVTLRCFLILNFLIRHYFPPISYGYLLQLKSCRKFYFPLPMLKIRAYREMIQNYLCAIKKFFTAAALLMLNYHWGES